MNIYRAFVVIMMIISLALKDPIMAVLSVTLMFIYALMIILAFDVIDNFDIESIKIYKYKINFYKFMWYIGLSLVIG